MMTRMAAVACAVLVGACSGTEPSPPVQPPAPSGWVYFSETRRFAPSLTQFWRIRPDGTGREQVPNPDELRAGPQFDVSQDGRRLAVNRASRLLIVPTDAPASSYLVTETDLLSVFRWSPSGHGVARARIDHSTGQKQLVYTPVDRSPESILLETDPANGFRPVSWFPDGDSLIFVDGRTGFRVLRLRDLSARALTPLTDWIEPSPSGRFGIQWEVDSVDYDTKKHWRLYDLSTGQLLRTVTHPRGLFRIAWSPDERHFVDLCQELTPGLEKLGLCVYDRATLAPITRLADPTPETFLDYPRWIP